MMNMILFQACILYRGPDAHSCSHACTCSFKLETVTNARMFSHAAHRQQQLNSAPPCSLIFVVGGR